jgi:hypothetical protein
VLKRNRDDILIVIGSILLALIGVAYLTPVQIRQPGYGGGSDAPIVLGIWNSASRYDWPLNQALGAWNASGVAIRFVRASSDRAQIVVTMASKGACGDKADVAACTEYGHPAGERRTIRIVQKLDKFDEAEVLVHELGHILGLHHDHSTRCTAMGPVLWLNCPSPPVGKWRCQLLSAVDIERAVQVDGGMAHAPTQPVFCSKRAAA